MKYSLLILFLLFFIILSDGLLNVANSGHNEDYFTFLSLVVRYLALLILIFIAAKSSWRNNIPKPVYILFVTFLGWNIITIARGVFSAAGYWDWKFLLLNSLLFFLIPLSFFVGKHLPFAQLVFKYVLKYLFLFGFVTIPLALVANRELYSRLMIPISFFILFIPWLKGRWKKLIVLVACASILVVIDFRTNIIKIGLSMLVLLLYFFRNYLRWLVKPVHAVLFLAPIVLFYLGITGSYNIFAQAEKSGSYTVKAQKGDLGEVNLTGDTRTFLYEEVLSTLYTNGSVMAGEGATGTYTTEYFETADDTGRRYGSEVGVLNLALYSGTIGVLIYLGVLFSCSWYAIYRSNNFLCKMLGLVLAVRWLLFFVEEFTNFDLNTFFLWLIMGLVANSNFRSMGNAEVRAFFRFNKQV
ncbi:hypothetical protein [Puia sp.]|uniref:hypothetical protein n=1 Tax=Puia sp. TaxID=2045100 RepID=UPI002F41E968